MELQTQIYSWIPSVHLIDKVVLFAIADKLVLKKDVMLDPKKRAVIDTVSGEFVSFMLSAARTPFRTALTIFVKMKEFTCLQIADDLRNERGNQMLGLAVMLPEPT